jgi:hypothetical protein
VNVPTSDKDWNTLLSYLPKDYEHLAVQHRVLNTQWPNAKVRDASTLLRLILLHVGADLPLRQTVALVAKGGGPSLTQVWLHKKMRRAQSYLGALVASLVSDVGAEATPERWAGYEMVCLDGSAVSGPGADGIDVRIHCVVRLHDLRVSDVRVTSVSVGETLKRFIWEPGQLVIGDRGYSNAPGIAWVVDHGADVLLRVNRGALPLYDESNAVIDVLDWCRSLQGHRAVERNVTIACCEGKDRRVLSGRLIGFRLPAEEAAKARERVRSEEGPSVLAEHLEAADYVVLFTTTPASRLSAARCIEAYRLRWQVELQFKRWKSLCHFDRLPNFLDETMCSWLTAKVLLGLLLDKVGSSAKTQASTKRPLARQAWKLTSIIWPLIVAALMPIRLANASECLCGALVDYLDALDGQHATRQVESFRGRYYAKAQHNKGDCDKPKSADTISVTFRKPAT